jgi:hypothetical protein
MAQRTQESIASTGHGDRDSKERTRLLAVEIRSRKFGFAAFEGSERLLDWGVRWYVKTKSPLNAMVSSRIRSLLILHTPSIVVTRRRNHYSANNRRIAQVIDLIRAESRRNSAKFVALTARHVQSHFESHGLKTKNEIATGLSQRFDELSWKLPVHPDKSYQSEAPSLVIFDAAATGIAYLAGAARRNDDVLESSESAVSMASH